MLLLEISTVSADTSHRNAGLFITPKSCIAKNSNDGCNQSVDIQWLIEEPADVCLFIASEALSLECWQNLLFTQSRVLVKAKENIIFELRNKASGEVIYSEPFKVYKKVARFRRKRRNPWSFY